MTISCGWLHQIVRLCSIILILLAAHHALAQDAGNTTEERIELLFWSSVQDTNDVAMYEAYLAEFPEGRFATLAKLKIRSLQGGQSGEVSGWQASAEKAKPALQTTTQPTQQPPENTSAVSTANDADSAKAVVTAPSSALSEQDCPECPELVQLAGGGFLMGSNDSADSASPPHNVSISYPFYIGKFEVTRAQWQFCVTRGGCKENPRLSADGDPTNPARPAFNISWQDATAYTVWLSDYTGRSYRLPTEAEWEFAARAGSVTRYWWGDNLPSGLADCRDCGGNWDKKQPAVVDSFPANSFGLHGTAGGVAEWVQDCWISSYKNAPADGSARQQSDCSSNVLRGGSWRNKSGGITSAYRINYDFNVRYVTNGFRVVREN